MPQNVQLACHPGAFWLTIFPQNRCQCGLFIYGKTLKEKLILHWGLRFEAMRNFMVYLF